MHGILTGKVLHKREKESGKLRMGGGSWTINMTDLEVVPDEINYITEKAKYTISGDMALLCGFKREFKGETKLVVPCRHWFITPIKGAI